MKKKYNLHIVTHTHWDREWYYTYEQFRFRLVKLVDSLIDLLENKKGFDYFEFDGQTIAIKDYLSLKPQNKEKLIKLISEKKIIIGPWYTQPNEFMSSAESLIRNLLLGKNDMDKYGCERIVNYLPDAFGHISQLPQIMKGFGLKFLVSWRGLPRDRQSIFDWTGADGSTCQVIALMYNYCNGVALPINEGDHTEIIDGIEVKRTGLDGRIKDIVGESERYVSEDILVMNGLDHAFPQPDIPDVIEKINESYGNTYAVHTTLSEYCGKLHSYVNDNDIKLKMHSGEIRDSLGGLILPASQSTRTDIKILSNKMETALEKYVEPFACFSSFLGYDYPKTTITKAWEYLIQNQAHDSICGSNVDEANYEIIGRYKSIGQMADLVKSQNALRLLKLIDVGTEDKIILINPLAYESRAIVTAKIRIAKSRGYNYLRLYDGSCEIPMEITDVHQDYIKHYNCFRGGPDFLEYDVFDVTFDAGTVPGLGYKVITYKDGEEPYCAKKRLKKQDGVMENEYLKISINSNGTIDIFDKQAEKTYKNIHYFEDCGEAGHGFSHIGPMGDKTRISLGEKAEIECVLNTEMKCVYRISIDVNLPKALNAGRTKRTDELTRVNIISDVILYTGAKRVDFHTVVNNTALDHRLRAVFPTYIDSDKSYAAQPFDIVYRNINNPETNMIFDGSREAPTNYHPQTDFCGISDGENGVSVSNFGLYEYEVMDRDDHAIAITLIRALNKLERGEHMHCSESDMPSGQLLGINEFDYSFIPYQREVEQSTDEVYKFKYIVQCTQNRRLEEETLPGFVLPEAKLPPSGSFVRVHGDGVALSAVKKSESGDYLVIRVFNMLNKPTEAAIKLCEHIAVHKVKLMNLDESIIKEMPLDDNGVRFALSKKEVVTVAFDIEKLIQ